MNVGAAIMESELLKELTESLEQAIKINRANKKIECKNMNSKISLVTDALIQSLKDKNYLGLECCLHKEFTVTELHYSCSEPIRRKYLKYYFRARNMLDNKPPKKEL